MSSIEIKDEILKVRDLSVKLFDRSLEDLIGEGQLSLMMMDYYNHKKSEKGDGFIIDSEKYPEEVIDFIFNDVVIKHISELRNIKSKVYGSSWRAEGEKSIFDNINRKIERIRRSSGISELDCGEDNASKTENILDTAIDLGVYSLLYASWIIKKKPYVFVDWRRRELAKSKEESEEYILALGDTLLKIINKGGGE